MRIFSRMSLPEASQIALTNPFPSNSTPLRSSKFVQPLDLGVFRKLATKSWDISSANCIAKAACHSNAPAIVVLTYLLRCYSSVVRSVDGISDNPPARIYTTPNTSCLHFRKDSNSMGNPFGTYAGQNMAHWQCNFLRASLVPSHEPKTGNSVTERERQILP